MQMSGMKLNRRVWINLFLGFSSGLPLALCGSTLQAWFTDAGLSLMTIGFLSLVGQPYAFKFIWAPLMDRFIPPFLGRRRGWMLITQLLLILLIATLTLFDPKLQIKTMVGLAFLLAFVSASQDIAIDAYRTNILHPHERGLGASFTLIGYRSAIVVSGAIALAMAQYLGWKITYLFMSACMVVGIIGSFLAPEPAQTTSPASFKDAVVNPFKEFFHRYRFTVSLAILLALIFYKMGDAFALALNSTFLLRDLHFSLSEVGFANKVVGLASCIAGGLAGGFLMYRWSLFKALMGFGLIQTLACLGYLALAIFGHHLELMMCAIALEQFTSGLGTTAFLALLMSLCHPKFSATQYALLSALTAIGRIYVGPLSAALVSHFGWVWFYGFVFAAGWPGLFIIWVLKKPLTQPQEYSLNSTLG
ncbi:MAG: MFS transporter [Gammaproteobacteria bacterium]|nr:MFS transporter [Gammaproteobacteria bacterium]